MNFEVDHPWNLTPRAAMRLQLELRGRVEQRDRLRRIKYVAGIDVGFESLGAIARAAVVVLSYPGLLPVDAAIAREPTRFPYVPGLLSFREVPVVLKALRRLRVVPDVLLCDGHGFSHPRRFGLACHIGTITGVATIGVAKTLLCGIHEPVPDRRAAWVDLCDRDETIAAVLRSRERVKPIYVSIGHRVSLKRAVALVMDCTPRYRLPETTRWAHRLASTPRGESDRLLRALRKNVQQGLANRAQATVSCRARPRPKRE